MRRFAKPSATTTLADPRILVDTNVLVWMATDRPGLSVRAAELLRDTSQKFYVSSISTNELSIKASRGKLRLGFRAGHVVAQLITELQATDLPLTHAHAAQIELLPWHHRDPFDRLLIAQAMVEGLSILSSDAVFEQYGVERIW